MACGAQHKSSEAGGKTWHKYTPLERALYQRVEPIKRVGSGLIKYTFEVGGHFVQCKAAKRRLGGSKSSFANVAMDKMGPIRRTPKWLQSRSQISLQAELLPAADIFLRYLCHFDASKVYLISPDPNFPVNNLTGKRMRLL
jgi:hypothetical protein